MTLYPMSSLELLFCYCRSKETLLLRLILIVRYLLHITSVCPLWSYNSGLMCLPTIMIANGKGLGICLMCLPTIMIANGKGLGIIQFILLLLNTVCKSSNNQNYSFWFELTRSQAYDLSALETLHHRCDFYREYKSDIVI
jgi:hypothetical protein